MLRNSPEMAIFFSLALGYGLGCLRFGSFQLGGVAGSLLVSMLVSLIGISVGSELKNILFSLFIYAVGYQSGPHFFRSLGRQSLKEVMLAIILAATGLLTIIPLARFFHLDKGLAAGLAAGGLTQTTIIGTADSALETLGLSVTQLHQLQDHVVVGFAVTYIFGTIGTIIFCITVVPRFMKRSIRDDAVKAETDRMNGARPLGCNEMTAMPDLVGRAYQITQKGLNVARVEEMSPGVTLEKLIRHKNPIGTGPDTVLVPGDRILLFGHRDHLVKIGRMIGKELPYSSELDVKFQSRNIVITHRDFVGKSLSQLVNDLSSYSAHGVYLVAVRRDGQRMNLAKDLHSQQGDIITIFGLSSDVQHVAQQVGKLLSPATKTDMVFHMSGILLGLILGLVVIHLGTMPLTLGGGGGALLSGLVFGWYQGRHPTIGVMPSAVSNFLTEFGLSGFVAVTGLQTGRQAFASIAHEGLSLLLLGAIVTIVPLVLTMLFGRYVLRYDNCALFAGALAGARSANPAFGEILTKAGNSVPTTSFVITYTVANIVLTLLGPLIVALV
ncbi:aspartate-alanine antiporter [Acetobacteraceae bacterium ESL0709]|nr:aspartate-alanine antiporter [Acetobacteraceae bacterium ESL0709]